MRGECEPEWIPLNKVKKFTYLGSMVGKGGGSDIYCSKNREGKGSFHTCKSCMEVKPDRQKD